jgi:hypothetical protein
MKVQIKLILSTIALTVLIWTYADQTIHELYTAPAVPIRLTPPQGPGDPFVLRVIDTDLGHDDQIMAELEFRGTKSQIRSLKQVEAPGGLRFTLPITTELQAGRQINVNLMKELADLPAIRERGLQLQSVRPDEVRVEVLRYRSVPIELRFNAGYHDSDLAVPPTYEPQVVKARVLDSDLIDGALPPLRVDLAQAIDEALSRPGQKTGLLTLNIPLVSTWPEIDAEFIPARITVTVALERRSVSKLIQSIPLDYLLDARGTIRRYHVELSDDSELLQHVNVSGPESKVEQLELETNRRQIVAFVNIEDTDLPDESETERRILKQVRFVLPPGFEDVEVTNKPRIIKLTVRRIATPENNGLTPIQ